MGTGLCESKTAKAQASGDKQLAFVNQHGGSMLAEEKLATT
jgi:hypothetical protein